MDEAGLVGLLHHADWTRLSLSAELTGGSVLFVAPGKRYRYRDDEGYENGYDGARAWALSPGDAPGSGRWMGGPEPPLDQLLCPAWLLESTTLQVRGRARACGREAFDVVITRQARLRDRSDHEPPWSAEALVDAELGFLLRLAEPGEEVTEFSRADFDPVLDLALFAPPPGSQTATSLGQMLSSEHPGWRAATTVAGLAAGGLGAWVRHGPGRRPTADLASAIPDTDPAPELAPDGVPPGPPVNAELLTLLHAGGVRQLTATHHQWIDVAALAARVPEGARRTGLGGVGLLMDAVSERSATAHTVSRLRIAGPGRYQIDHDGPRRRRPVTVACDGQHQWQIYPDQVTTGPPRALPADLAQLADPSWLLACRLTGGEPVTLAGRPSYRVTITAGPAGRTGLLYPAAIGIIDAELGLITRLTSYLGPRAVQRHELRDLSTDAGEFRVDIPSGLPVTSARRAQPRSPFTSA
jgi:hypothetical protein